MGTVSFVVERAESALNGMASSQFGAVAGSLGTVLMLAATLALLFLIANMMLQVRPMDVSEFVPLLVKMGLILIFALNWVQFDRLSSAIIDSLDNIAGMLIGSITGETGSGPAFFAARFDQMAEELADHANAIGENLNWVGGAIMGVFMAVLLAIFSGVAALMLVLSKMVVTLLIGLAPIMISLTLFRATEDYFRRWLSALIAWSLYPIVIASVFSITFGLLNQMLAAVGDPSDMQNIGAALPFLAMIMLSLALMAGIPVIVRTISGDINSGFAGAATGAIMRGAYQRIPPRPNLGGRAQSAPREANQPPRQSEANAGMGQVYLQQLERAKRLNRNR
ncbi:type IV secretion system protein [Thalassococcus sp. S3]|uniref:type IV secretion system protein n=1 Tax=Thalassococcus sp. S3 TaxID=2017482 RepID=UPI0010247C06|nr:type IV secretion system protein [Thalassococcus sp. S3]QBF30775.1 hypothetical protein CFI11_06030 [Thalassococcus sp. S3]